jgi:4-hydroxythreonine-4-phosphate dehydrogenase
MGDAAGIGPEISIKAVLNQEVRKVCRPFIIGSGAIIGEAFEIQYPGGSDWVSVYKDFDDIDFSRDNNVKVLDVFPLEKELFAASEVNAVCGEAAVKYMDEAASLCLAGKIDAFASAPINKEGMAMAGYDFAGATEYLASVTGAKEYAMVLFFGPIKMFYATNHVSVKDALGMLDIKLIYDKLLFIDRTLSEMGESNKTIAVAAVNPHAGENGKMGREEIDIQTPAIEKAVSEGCLIEGPLPADTLFIKAKEGEYGAVLAMFHDQGNIAAKLLNFGSGVTYIHGLPVIRTSVAHGTAYDIAGQGVASEVTLVQAILTAADIAGNRT